MPRALRQQRERCAQAGREHDDDAVKAAAIAMRHSSKTAASAAYDKGACDRRVSAAMKVAAEHSAKLTAEASSNVAFGRYVYDVVIDSSDLDITRRVQEGILTIKPGV